MTSSADPAIPDAFPVWKKVLCYVLAAILSTGATTLILVVTAGLFNLRETLRQSSSVSQLHEIANAAIQYAKEHQQKLPEAADFPDYAFQLAEAGHLRDPYVWFPPDKHPPDGMQTVSIPKPGEPGKQIPHPALSGLRPQFSVVLGGLRLDHPPTTPIAWTRGLDPETGRWGPDSPYYRGKGGLIAFLDGRIEFRPDLHADGGALRDFKTGKPTASLRDALPPGARLSETRFTRRAETAWSRLRLAIQDYVWPVFTGVILVIFLWGICFLVWLAMWFEHGHSQRPFPLPRWIGRTLLLTPAVAFALGLVFFIPP